MDKLQWEYDIVVTRADKEHKVALNGVCDIKVNWFWQIEKKKSIHVFFRRRIKTVVMDLCICVKQKSNMAWKCFGVMKT